MSFSRVNALAHKQAQLIIMHRLLRQRSCNQRLCCLMGVTYPNTSGVDREGGIWLPLVILGCWTWHLSVMDSIPASLR